MPTVVEFIIPSCSREIEKVEKKLAKFIKPLKFNEDDRDSLAIALTEMVANAVVHGNKKIKSKKVHVTFKVLKNGLRMSVRDEGTGFNPDKIADPLAEENLFKESGRGVFIVRTLMDDVKFDFSKGGTEIIMVKNFSK